MRRLNKKADEDIGNKSQEAAAELITQPDQPSCSENVALIVTEEKALTIPSTQALLDGLPPEGMQKSCDDTKSLQKEPVM